MQLPDDFYKPFDITYKEITDAIETHRANIPYPVTAKWLNCLVDGFKKKRNEWPQNPLQEAEPLYAYMKEASRLRSRLLRLTACVYLHIAFDLPAVLADEWPGKGVWNDGPDEEHGEDAYFALGNIFPEVLYRVSLDFEVTGISGFLLRFLPSDATVALSRWVMLLRNAAWRHGRRLNNVWVDPDQRSMVQSKMIEAMTAALSHVKNSKPWKAGLLAPPDSAIAGMAVIAFTSPGISYFSENTNVYLLVSVVGNLLIMLYFVWSHWSEQYRKELICFIDQFGQNAMDYMEVAITDPKSLDEYLKKHDPKQTL